MNNLLITGGAGFIGANFVHYCKTNFKAVNIVVLDALTYSGNRESIKCFDTTPGYVFIHGDICNSQLIHTIMHEHDIDTVIHFAAESHVDRSIQAPDTFIQSNIIGTYTLLKNARQYWQVESAHRDGHRFHHVSTDEVFGSLGFGDPAFHEQTPYNPSSPYAASKAASDHLVRAWHRTYQLNVTISNCSNNYGPYQYPEKLIPLTILNALHGKAIPIYGEGVNIRDWLYVADHCRGLDLVLNKGVPGQTYNIGGLSELNNLQLVTLICSSIDEIFSLEPEFSSRFPDCPAANGKQCDTLISFIKDRPGHDLRYAMDIHKARNELGFEPGESLHTGIKKTTRWYLENENWWRNVINDSYAEWLQVQYG